MRVALAIIAGTSATFIFEDTSGDIEGGLGNYDNATLIIAKGMKMQLPFIR